MWTIIIGSVIGFLLPVVILWIKDKKYFDFFEYFGLYFISMLIIGFISFWISVALPVSYQKKEYEAELANLNDKSIMSGHFFLGTGNINGKMKYVFYYKCGASYYMEMIDYNYAEIIYTDKQPCVRQISFEKSNSIINYFSLDLEKPKTEFIFFIPNGSISNSYELDSF